MTLGGHNLIMTLRRNKFPHLNWEWILSLKRIGELPKRKRNVRNPLGRGKLLGLNHATVLRYFENFDWFYKTDKDFADTYEQIYEQFQSNSVIYTQLNEFELKKQLILLQKENKTLYLRNQNLEKQIKELEQSKVMYIESKM